MSAGRTGVYVLTDISSLSMDFGEPDDAQSLVRLLCYTDRLDIKGIGATWTKHDGRTHPELVRRIVAAYRDSWPNLNKLRERDQGSSSGFQNPAEIESRIYCGREGRGVAKNVGEGRDTPLSLDLERAMRSAEESGKELWVLVWGAPLDLAQALWRIGRAPKNVRVYAILDQYDDSGPWIRANFPALDYYRDDDDFRTIYRGGDRSSVSREWVEKNVKCRTNALARIYPVYDYPGIDGVKEGDTPSFLHLINPAWRGDLTSHRREFQLSFARRLSWADGDGKMQTHKDEYSTGGTKR